VGFIGRRLSQLLSDGIGLIARGRYINTTSLGYKSRLEKEKEEEEKEKPRRIYETIVVVVRHLHFVSKKSLVLLFVRFSISFVANLSLCLSTSS
jgi:hypothetical protein